MGTEVAMGWKLAAMPCEQAQSEQLPLAGSAEEFPSAKASKFLEPKTKDKAKCLQHRRRVKGFYSMCTTQPVAFVVLPHTVSVA